MSKLISIRKPKLRLTPKGLRVTSPSARIGGAAGVNVSKRGVSGSFRTKLGSYNTRRGCSLPVGLLALAAILLATFARKP